MGAGTREFDRVCGALLVLAIVLAVTGCNRVPGEPLAMSIAALPDGFEATSTPVPEGGIRSVPELCRAACGHWAKLRFLEPVGYDQLPDEARAATDDLLTKQRTANEESCRTACERRGDRERANCLLGLSTIESVDTCARSPEP